MSSTTNIQKEENKASLFAQPYVETENPNVEPEKGGCDGEREADIYSVTSGELSDISGANSDTSCDISDSSDELFPTTDPPIKKKSHLTKIVNALKSLRPRHSDQLFYLRTEKKYFGPNSSKPNFFGSKTKAQLDSPKTSSDEQLTPPKKSGSDVSQKENSQKSAGKASPKNSGKISPRKTSLRESPKKTDKLIPPSKIPRISDENGTKTTLKKSATPSKIPKTEDPHGKTPDETQAKKEIKTVKAKPVNGKPTAKHEDAIKKRPPSADKSHLSKSRPPSEKLTDVKKPSSVQGQRPSSRPSAAPRVSTAKKEQESETKKKQRLSNSTTSSTESAGERKPSPEKTPISLVKDERYNPPSKVDQSLVDEAEKKKPNNLEQLEMFEEVKDKEQPKELSFLERLQQNVKSYFSPRGSETVRMEATVEAKKKVSDGGIHMR